ncbi:MAG: peptide deformylase, partial [Gammaproteobacteria bacterium]
GNDSFEEGCLSVPGVFEPVERAQKITVKALNAEGEECEFNTEGLLAVCIQHEMDHLDGKLFVDYLSELKRQRLKKKARKAKRSDFSGAEASRPTL